MRKNRIFLKNTQFVAVHAHTHICLLNDIVNFFTFFNQIFVYCELIIPIAGITNSADCLGYCVMTGLLWPNRVGQYLLLASTKYSGEQLIKRIR